MLFQKNQPAESSAWAGKNNNKKPSFKLPLFSKERVGVRLVLGFLVFCFAGGLVLFPAGRVKAQMIQVISQEEKQLAAEADAKRAAEDAKNKAWYQKILPALQKVASKGLHSAISNVLQELAYQTATRVAWGGAGQKPTYYTEDWSVFTKNVADNALGTFIETLGRENGFEEFNLCKPSFDVGLKIGFGLTEFQRPKKPECTFSKMKENWDKALQEPDFLPKFQDMFNPTSNDLGIALSSQTVALDKVNKDLAAKLKGREVSQDWLDFDDTISGQRIMPPGWKEQDIANSGMTMNQKLFLTTQDIVVDAANVFVNQLLIEAWKRGMYELTKNSPSITEPHSGDYDWLSSENAGPANTGLTGSKERLNKIIQPNFTVRGDYDILAELTQCPDPTKAGPTNCVISDNFRQAIAEKLTVGEAIEQGYLNSGGVFGFKADGLEPAYNEGYPYRSMIILRKFRILPMGWEVAGQYIKKYNGNPNIGGGKNLGELVACFDQNDEFAGYYADWCAGLVDPNWVLKAPLNYCKRAGPGPEIVSAQITGEGKTSKLEISRNDNYCADEQSCIKENKDGSCQLYGYCAEERRKWEFEGDACEPKYNTCQTFRSGEGNTVSYLENSLDYSNCSVGTAGCKWYCQNYDFADGVWTCGATAAGDRIYFDRDAEECAAENEGCHEFIRTKPGLGTNLVFNPSFEDYTGDLDDESEDDFEYWGDIGEATSGGVDGFVAIKLTAEFFGVVDVGSAGYNIGGEAYTFSLYAKNCGVDGKIGLDSSEADLETTGDWQYFNVSRVYPESILGDSVQINIYGFDAGCLIDAVKLERGEGTVYSGYRDEGLAYLKLAPDYLGCDEIDDPAECDKFARECNQRDEGCEMYSSQTKNMDIPAKVVAGDYCPAECVGYDIFVQKSAIFDSARDAYFIPKTAKTCSAKALGCDEFTNLDTIARGGEEKEYYSALRQCIKPSAPGVNCDDFYTWEGSDETGYQLRVFQMKKDGMGNPAVTEDDSLDCTQAIYNLPSNDPAYNADCREFYNRAGQVSYHLISRTITCSDECKTFRRSEKNIDASLDSSNCQAGGDGSVQYLNTKDNQFHWDGVASECVFCKAGGYWSTEQNACMYDAIPGEGQTCSAAEAGCREYAGNTGNNMMVAASYDFEGSAEGWEGFIGVTAAVNSNALMVGGNSLNVSGTPFSAFVSLGDIISQNGTYVLSFLAKADSAPASLTAKIGNETGWTDFSGQADLRTGDWGIYQFNLTEFKHTVGDSENLTITGTGDFYIDDIKLTQIADKYYLVKNSWATPVSCLNDIFGNPAGALHNLGCDEYADRDNNTHYLKSFSRLCQESAVGCELMIDTHNSSDYKADIKNDSTDPANFGFCEDSELGCIEMPADNYVYVVYDKSKECSAEDKGCQFLGESYKYEGDVLFEDKYIKNNPDKYNTILCSAAADGCEEWFAGEGASYFKNPGDQVCDWRLKASSAEGNWGWYKKKIKRCDEDGSGAIAPGEETEVCLADRDCSADRKCITDEYDYDCPIAAYKTIGQGGLVYQPSFNNVSGYWAGMCPASESGCTEYADPISVFAENEIYNESFALNLDNDSLADGWSAAGTQEITVEPDTFYIMAVIGENSLTADVLDANGGLLPFNSAANDFYSSPVQSLQIPFTPAGERKSLAFMTGGSTRRILVTASNLTPINNQSKVELKKAVIEYQLEQNVNGQECNGVVNFENGCVLFNARAQDGTRKLPLSWDADLTYNDGAGLSPKSGAAGENDANSLLKVRPDRECGQWLACREKEKVGEETICLGIGICDKFDDKGGCARFVDEYAVPENIPLSQKYPSVVKSLDNLSGYAKVGLDSEIKANYGTNAYPYYNDYYKFGEMETFGVSSNILNWDFEDLEEKDSQAMQDFGDPDVPYLGWTCDTDGSGGYACETIDDPVEAQDENVCFKKEGKNCFIYAPSGKSFLKVINKGGGDYGVSTMPGYEISVAKDREHMLTAYINTDKISDGKARLSIIGYKESSSSFSGTGGITRFLESTGTIKSAEFDSLEKKGWRLEAFTFITQPDTAAIRIKLSFTDGASGSYYIDNIRIKPMLESRDDWKTHQSCQLYPLDDSLSCEYYENSGIRYKGRYGYCLEYDRYPGSSDACLLWWPTPDGADRVNEYCGNGNVDGEEDCDCGTDTKGTPDTSDDEPIYNCFSGPLPNGVSNTPPLPNYPNSPSPYGSHKYNQYRCSNCVWTDGWCGDGIAQSATNSEHCDWNDVNARDPNLKEQTCWSDHSELGDKEGEVPNQAPNHYAQYDFKHPGKGAGYFYDYLWGDLACYNNSAENDRCKFNVSGCSDKLANGAHTRKQCVDAGGVVVNKDGQAVTDTAGNITNRALAGSNFAPFFCKFTGSWENCDLNNLCQTLGMSGNYNGWADTTAAGCEKNFSWTDLWGCTSMGATWECSITNCCSVKAETDTHSWGSGTGETCDDDECDRLICDESCEAASRINAIGCY